VRLRDEVFRPGNGDLLVPPGGGDQRFHREQGADAIIDGGDQEAVAIELVGEIEAKATAADEMEVFGEFHGMTSD